MQKWRVPAEPGIGTICVTSQNEQVAKYVAKPRLSESYNDRAANKTRVAPVNNQHVKASLADGAHAQLRRAAVP